MGPAATVLLMQRIIAATPARGDQDHIPMLVEHNPQTPSRIAALLHGAGASPGPVLAGMARRLQQAGADCLLMPCNTAHHYAGEITAAGAVPLLNMVELTAAKLAAVIGAGGRAGLLASPAVRLTGLYEQPLAERGLTPLYPHDDAPLLSAIELIKRRGAAPAAQRTLARAGGELQARGAAAVALACTEFSLLRDQIALDIPVIDTLDALTEAAVAFDAALRTEN